MNLLVDARPIVDAARGGVSRVALEICVAYAESFPDDTLICVTTGTKKPTLPDRLATQKNVRHLHISWPNKLWSIASSFGLVSLISETQKRTGKIDAAFFPNLGFIGAIPKNIPATLLLHDLSFLIEPKWFSARQRFWHHAVHAKRLIKTMPQLLAVSETTKRDAVQLLNISRNRISVIPIGSTLHQTASQTTNRADTPVRPYILTMGAGDPRKNVGTAIEAVRALRMEEKFHDLELIIIGRSTRSSLPAPRQPWVQFVEKPTDEHLKNLYTNAAVFLYPSWYEGFGLPLHEAAQFGTPRVASTSGAVSETAPMGTFFANPSKPQQWTEAIKLAQGSKRTIIEPPNQNWKEAVQILRQTFTKKYQ